MALWDMIRHAFRRSKRRDWRDFRPTEAELDFARLMLAEQEALEQKLGADMPRHWRDGGVKIHVQARVGGGTDNPFDHRSYPPKFADFFDRVRAPEWMPAWNIASVERDTYARMEACHEMTAARIVEAVTWRELDAILQICGTFAYSSEWSHPRYTASPAADAAIATALERASAEEPPQYQKLLSYLVEEGAMIPTEQTQ